MHALKPSLSCAVGLLLCAVLIMSLARSGDALASSSSPVNLPRDSRYYPAFFQSLPSMRGKTVVITGASRGLGYATAAAVAQKGGTVVMLNRPGDGARRALQRLEENAPDDVEARHHNVDCDLLNFDDVRKACRKVSDLTKETGVDVLCLNAGIMLQPDTASVDGYDITASTNMLSHFLIARELLPALERAVGPARVVTMSSGSGYGGPPLDARYFERRGGNLGGDQAGGARYHQSKLANLAFTAALHDKLERSGRNVQAVACTPGVCGTDMFLHATTVMSGTPSPLNRVPSVEDGAMAQLKCVCDPEVRSGELWGPGRDGILERTPLEPPLILVTEESKASLWEVCEQAVGEFAVI